MPARRAGDRGEESARRREAADRVRTAARGGPATAWSARSRCPHAVPGLHLRSAPFRPVLRGSTDARSLRVTGQAPLLRRDRRDERVMLARRVEEVRARLRPEQSHQHEEEGEGGEDRYSEEHELVMDVTGGAAVGGGFGAYVNGGFYGVGSGGRGGARERRSG